MNEIKKYKILDGLPPYGKMYIPISRNNKPFYNEGLAVQFFKSDGSDWFANFDTGNSELSEVIELNDSPYLLVIAKGICYFINPDEIIPVEVFGNYEKLLRTIDGRIILQDTTRLTIIESNGTYWHSCRISLDGIKNLKLEGNIITGDAYFPQGADNYSKFSYDLISKKLIGGSF